MGNIEIKKSKISYWNSIFSISTVLFLTGFLGLFIIIAKNTSDVLKESLSLHIELQDTSYNEYNILLKKIKCYEQIKKIKFISKQDAALKLKNEVKEDFIKIIGNNPLYNAINVNLKSEYFDQATLEKLREDLLHQNYVNDVSYPQLVSKSLDKNLKKITIIIIAITFFLLLIAVVLIDSTIRLAMFSDRFLIKSMQLVGATRWFIIKPYIIRSFFNGILSAIISFAFLILVLYFISRINDIISIKDELYHIFFVFLGLIILGIIISTISTFFAVNKYLRTKLELLY